MIFIAGLASGWIFGSMTVVICSICIASGEHDRERNDKEQEEYLKKYNEQKRRRKK